MADPAHFRGLGILPRCALLRSDSVKSRRRPLSHTQIRPVCAFLLLRGHVDTYVECGS